jgi:hypothetical protein
MVIADEKLKLADFETHADLLRACAKRYGFGSGAHKPCVAIAKHSGERCKKAALKGYSRCLTHGKRTMAGPKRTVKTAIRKEITARIKMDWETVQYLESKLGEYPVSPETRTHVETYHADFHALWKPWQRILLAATELYRRGQITPNKLEAYTRHLNVEFKERITHKGKMAGTGVVVAPRSKSPYTKAPKAPASEVISAEDLTDF